MDSNAEGLLATLISALESQGEKNGKKVEGKGGVKEDNQKTTTSSVPLKPKPPVPMDTSSQISLQPPSIISSPGHSTLPKKRAYQEAAPTIMKTEPSQTISTNTNLDFDSIYALTHREMEKDTSEGVAASSSADSAEEKKVKFGNSALPLSSSSSSLSSASSAIPNNVSSAAKAVMSMQEMGYHLHQHQQQALQRQQQHFQDHSNQQNMMVLPGYAKHRTPPINFDVKKEKLASLLQQFKTKFYNEAKQQQQLGGGGSESRKQQGNTPQDDN